MENRDQTQLEQLTEKIQKVQKRYGESHPEITMDRDYFPLKITEEWGECMQAYLMLSDRGRQKGKTKDEINESFLEEFADVFSYLLLFAANEKIDIEDALNKKWFKYLDK